MSVAPEVFRLREKNRHSEGSKVPAGREKKARAAVRTCPEEAISIEEWRA
ncbi:MAG: ferredoxin [Deltaproteobacteria bacterium]|nr:ferredoxin [Deltaproteobacteria bacterium]